MRRVAGRDYRTDGYYRAFQEVIGNQPEEALCLSVGGGPNREHRNLVNLNIAAFPNVDVVADAYRLPYANGSVDAVYCEAVLEHLEFPTRAVAEMWRVLRIGGQVFAATPFIQWYHGYPNHFQNFTITGHERLFARAGFRVNSSGTSVGPTVALWDLLVAYAHSYPPFPMLRRALGWGIATVSIFAKPLDYWVNKLPDSHKIASATYVRATKLGNT